MRFTSTLAASAAVGAASAQNYMGFNSGATLADRSAKFKEDFVAEFETAAALNGAPGDFNSVRLYTNIQAYSENDPIEAFEAAIETNTNILLGVWASGTDNIDNEISALKKALDAHGSELADLVIGVTIGSEDLYRTSATGVQNESGVGNTPDAIVGFIDDFRKAFKNGPLSEIPVGHADTWDVWGNSTNQPVIDAIDFIAVHEYPYYENDKGNHIDNAGSLFDRAYQITIDAAGGKPVWVTETGWPYVGPDWDEAEASVDNAKTYWDEVGCRVLFNKTPTFWYTLRDSNPDNKMKFAITDDLSTEPLFDLTCPDSFDTETTTTSRGGSSSTKTSTKASTKTSVASSSEETESATSTFTSASASTTPDDDDEDSSDEGSDESNSGGNNDNSDEGSDDSNNGGNNDNSEDGSNSGSDEGSEDGGSNSGSGGNDGASQTEDLPAASSTPTEVPEAAASGLKIFSTFTYAVLGLVGAAFLL